MTKQEFHKELKSIKETINDFISRVDGHGVMMHTESTRSMNENSDGVLDIADLSDENSNSIVELAEMLEDINNRLEVLEK